MRALLIILLILITSASAHGTVVLREDTAVTVKVGPFVATATGASATGLTITQADVRLSKNGGDMVQKNDATAATHDEIGMYDIPLDATDTDTAGVLTLSIAEAATFPLSETFMVMPQQEYDSLYGTDVLQVDIVQVGGSAATLSGTVDANMVSVSGDTTAADNLELMYDGTGLVGDTYPAYQSQLAAAATNVSNILTDTDTTIPGLIAALNNLSTADIDARLAAYDGPTNAEMIARTLVAGSYFDPAVDTVSNVTLVGTVTTLTGHTPQTGDSFARLGAPAGASVSADVAALQTDLDNTSQYQTDISSLATVANQVLMMGSTFNTSTDSLEAIRDRGDAAWTGSSGLTVAAIADGVWDELVADHSGVGSTGESLTAAGVSGDPWATSLPGAYGSGTAGYIMDQILNSALKWKAVSYDTVTAVTVNSVTGALETTTYSDGTVMNFTTGRRVTTEP